MIYVSAYTKYAECTVPANNDVLRGISGSGVVYCTEENAAFHVCERLPSILL